MTWTFNKYGDAELIMDIESLANPIPLEIPISITASTQSLYFQADLQSPPSGWNNAVKNLGLVGAGNSKVFSHNTITRNTPTLTAGKLSETITVRLRAYTDSGYSNLVGTVTKDFTVIWIDSTHASWTLLDTDAFPIDVEGWTKTGTGGSLYWDNTNYRSAPGCLNLNGAAGQNIDANKTFTIPAATEAYITLHVRLDDTNARLAIYASTWIIPTISDDSAVPQRSLYLRIVGKLLVNSGNSIIVRNAIPPNQPVSAIRIDDVKVIYK